MEGLGLRYGYVGPSHNNWVWFTQFLLNSNNLWDQQPWCRYLFCWLPFYLTLSQSSKNTFEIPSSKRYSNSKFPSTTPSTCNSHLKQPLIFTTVTMNSRILMMKLPQHACHYKDSHCALVKQAGCGLVVSVSRRSRDPLRPRPRSHLGRIGKRLSLSLGTECLDLGLSHLGLMHKVFFPHIF